MIIVKNNSARSFILFILITGSLFSCKRTEKFTRESWDEGDGITFIKRDLILDDLLKTHQLKGLKYKQVTSLLHDPQRHSFTSRSFSYEVTRKMDGIDTLYTKDLVFYLNSDSVVTDTKVVERDYKKKKDKK